MLFLFATPIIVGSFGNFMIPLMIGARDMAFPRLNALSYWVFLFGGLFMYGSLIVGSPPNNAWFAYAPLTNQTYSPGPNQDFWSWGLLFLTISSTVIRGRRPKRRSISLSSKAIPQQGSAWDAIRPEPDMRKVFRTGCGIPL